MKSVSIIEKIRQQSGLPLVVLIDEYDKPILDALEYPEFASPTLDQMLSNSCMLSSFTALPFKYNLKPS